MRPRGRSAGHLSSINNGSHTEEAHHGRPFLCASRTFADFSFNNSVGSFREEEAGVQRDEQCFAEKGRRDLWI